MLAAVQLRQWHRIDDGGPCPASVCCPAHRNAEADPPARLRLVEAEAHRAGGWMGRRLGRPRRGGGDLGPREGEDRKPKENECRAGSGSLGGNSGDHTAIVVVAGYSDQAPKCSISHNSP